MSVKQIPKSFFLVPLVELEKGSYYSCCLGWTEVIEVGKTIQNYICRGRDNTFTLMDEGEKKNSINRSILSIWLSCYCSSKVFLA